jgi:hypothetical protein
MNDRCPAVLDDVVTNGSLLLLVRCTSSTPIWAHVSKTIPALDADLINWIATQPVFFVATAPDGPGGHVNLSPKAHDTFRVLDPRRIAYVDLTGSVSETSWLGRSPGPKHRGPAPWHMQATKHQAVDSVLTSHRIVHEGIASAAAELPRKLI